MIYFLIPLRAKKASSDWETVVKLFNYTLNSIFNQTNPDFKVLVGIHDMPELSREYDSRLEFIKMDYPNPAEKTYPRSTRDDQRLLDKYYKKRFLMTKVKAYGGGYVMFVDADDFVSNKISALINSKDVDKNGYYFSSGYEFYIDTYKIRYAPKFTHLCGTSAIINYTEDELPSEVKFEGYNYLSIFRSNNYLFDFPHPKWRSLSNTLNKPLSKLPFTGALYTMNSGENISANAGNIGKRRMLIRSFTPLFGISKKMIKEFSLPNKKA